MSNQVSNQVPGKVSSKHSGYRIISVEQCLPPQGAGEGNWYCYIIASADNTLVGYRSGTRNEVYGVARDCAEHLNRNVHAGIPARLVRPAFVRELPGA